MKLKIILALFITFLFSFELSAGIITEALSSQGQYIVAVIAVACSSILCKTPLKVVKDKLMAILFAGNIAMLAINALNIFIIQNWSDKMLFINFGLAFMSLAYFYIYHYVIPKPENA